MAYRYDIDLRFLGEMVSQDLGDLVDCLTHDKDGDARLTEHLTHSKGYQTHHPDHHQYWEEIAEEIQCYGANTFATLLRGGQGVEYRRVLMDVCDKMKVHYDREATAEVIESSLLMKVLSDALDKMTPEALRELALESGLKNVGGVTAETLVGAFQTVFRAGGIKSYELTLVVVDAILRALIGRGLTLAGNAALTRTMAILTGPIGWVITGVWTAIDLAGAAYRVTIPAVIQVAVLRQKYLHGRSADQRVSLS